MKFRNYFSLTRAVLRFRTLFLFLGCLWIFGSTLAAPSAQAKVSFSLLGGSFQRLSTPSRTAGDGITLTDQKWLNSYGGGLLLHFEGAGRLGLGLGGLYVPFRYSASAEDTILGESQTLSETYAVIRAPVFVSFRLLRLISLHAGTFYDYSSSIDSELGFLAGAQVKVPLGKSLQLLILPSYQMGLRVYADGTRNTEWNILAGFKF